VANESYNFDYLSNYFATRKAVESLTSNPVSILAVGPNLGTLAARSRRAQHLATGPSKKDQRSSAHGPFLKKMWQRTREFRPSVPANKNDLRFAGTEM
jgi:muramidase (phage lysozyme)